MNETTKARLAEVLAKQRPYAHAIVVIVVKHQQEHPDWVEDRYFIGSHDECDRWFNETILPDRTIKMARGTCTSVAVN